MAPGPLAGSVALVTGASSGIGEGVTLALAAAGASVFATGRRLERLNELMARIEAGGGVAEVIAGDITNEEFARGLVDHAVARFGKLNILVNSAGIMYPGKVENANIAEWRHSMDLNLFSSLYTCSAAIPVMRNHGRGDIFNISSLSGRRPTGGPYGTSKFALTAFNEGLRTEVAPYGIRVCIVEPGATTSEIWDKVPDPSYREFLKNHVEQEGAMKPEDIGSLIVLACSLPQRANVSQLMIRPTSDVRPM